jgi:hypothetical protein
MTLGNERICEVRGRIYTGKRHIVFLNLKISSTVKIKEL